MRVRNRLAAKLNTGITLAIFEAELQFELEIAEVLSSSQKIVVLEATVMANDHAVPNRPRVDNPIRQVASVEERPPFTRLPRKVELSGWFVSEIAEVRGVGSGDCGSYVRIGSISRAHPCKEVLHVIERSIPLGFT